MPLSPNDPDYNAIMRQHRDHSQVNRATPDIKYQAKYARAKAKALAERNKQN